MNEYKVFVASSMAEEKLRKELREGIESLNQDFSNFNASLTPLIVGDGLQATGGINTQDDYYDKIISSDFFILFVRNGNTVGDKSYKEYKTAVEQYRNTGKPFVKVYVLKENDAEVDVKLRETGEDFEQLVGLDGRYLDYVTKIKDEHGNLMDIDTSFIIRVKDYLKKIICYEPHTSKSQDELSYKTHIANSRQSRDCEAKYFTREYLDGRINSILNNYSLVILDGSAYSGKTRAAYNLMTNREEWKDAKFYVFNGNNNLSLDALGRLSPNTSGEGSNTVYFIDDINDVIANSRIEARDNKPFFRFISEYVRNESRVKYSKTTIIISVSGKMSEEQKQKFYENLFGLPENEYSYESHLKNFIVKFDIYDKRSFIALLSEMKRHGYFFDYKLRPGNYTIGSIFVKENEIENSIKIIVNNNNDKIRVLRTIYSHWMFRHYMDGYYSADFEELKALYSNKEDENCKLLDDIIEELRQKGLLVKEENRISIDVYVIDAIKALYYSFDDSMNRLMKFAENENNVDWSSARMAYCLCDKKNFSVEQLLKILSYLNYKYFKHKVNGKINVPESLCKLLSKSSESKSSEDFYLKIFCGKFFSCLPNDKIKEYLAEIESNTNDEMYKELYKIVVYALFSKDRTFTLSEEREYLSKIFDDNGNMKEPFNIEDLKNIHNLKRLTPYLKKTAKEIIELAINAEVDGWEQSEESSSDFSWGQDENSDSSNLMYIKQLGLVIIEALHKSADYEDFINCISDIKESTSECVKQAVSHKLSSFLYKQIDKIAKNFSSEDRKKLFDFILNINDENGVFDSEQKAWEHSYKVYALNKLLPLMNENDAVAAYRQMQENNKPDNKTIDSYSLSMLMNNPLLNYEDLLPFAEEYSESEDSFIIFNHLMKKVKTKSDADYVCRSLMGVRRPSDLKDQNAFGAYMEIKHIRSLDAVRLIKDWKKKFEGKCLSLTSVNIFLGKLNFWHLKRLLLDTDIPKETYEEDYGLDYEKEIEPARLNPICISRLFDKLSTSASQALKYKIKNQSKIQEIKDKNESKIQEIKEATDAIFNDIMVKDKGLIIDDMRNGNATLLYGALRHD